MIILYFRDIEKESCRLLRPPEQWTDELWFSAFFGSQIFLVDDSDFSGDYPTLGFARQLKAISTNLKFDRQGGEYADPECENPAFLKFIPENNDTRIQLINVKQSLTVSEASLSTDVLYDEATKHFNRVLHYCSQLVPQIKTNAEVQLWLSDLSMPAYSHRL